MSPAPFVSTILSSESLGTAYDFGLESVGLRLAAVSDGEDDATRVDSAPWVMMTRRALDELDFLNEARLEAMVSSESSCC